MLLGIWLVTGTDGRWQLGVGDPSLLGWLTFVSYIVACASCLRASGSARFGAQKLSQVSPDEASNQRALAWMWLGLSVCMMLLGLNKQLDLQTLFIEVGRDLAKTQGWYGGRRVVQMAFLVTLTLSATVIGLSMAYALRKVLRRIFLVFVGLGLIAGYVLVRAAAFNHLAPGDSAAAPIWLLELGGIAAIAFAAHRATVPWERASG